MTLGKDALKILKLADAHEMIDFEDACRAVFGSIHSPYAPENLEYLEENDLIEVHSEMMPEGYEKTTIRIKPAGQAELKAYREQTREKWITRCVAFSALIVSIISLTWQILSSAVTE